MTHGEIVKRIVGLLRLNNVDERISSRLVLRTLKDKATNYISQKLLDRTISKEYNIYSDLKCYEFEKVESVRCPIIEFRICKVLMKGKKPLPKLIFSRHGSSIKSVTSVDGIYELTLTDPSQYRRDKKRKYSINKEVKFYVDSDNYPYIPDQEIYAVDIKLATVETEDLTALDTCTKCDTCKSGWDYEFKTPDKLLEVVIQDTLQTLLQTYKSVQPDENPNSNEYSRQ